MPKYASTNASFGDAEADYKQALSLSPDDEIIYNALAWLGATCPDGHYRDGRRAVEFARRACELDHWTSNVFKATLAAAYAELGDFGEAQSWQLRADSQTNEGQRRLQLYRRQSTAARP